MYLQDIESIIENITMYNENIALDRVLVHAARRMRLIHIAEALPYRKNSTSPTPQHRRSAVRVLYIYIYECARRLFRYTFGLQTRPYGNTRSPLQTFIIP